MNKIDCRIQYHSLSPSLIPSTTRIWSQPNQQTYDKPLLLSRQPTYANNVAVSDSLNLIPTMAQTIYADYAGASLPLPQPPSSTPGPSLPNPHTFLTPHLPKIRQRVLSHFHVTPNTHSIIFGSGTTSCVQSLFLRFPWQDNGICVGDRYLHNSVLGVRNWVVRSGGVWDIVEDVEDVKGVVEEVERKGFVVVVWSGECNLRGVRRGLGWGRKVKRDVGGIIGGGKKVVTVVDAARLVCGADVDLGNGEGRDIDILACSFYKMFGMPTGLGCLVVRNESLVEELVRRTVEVSMFAGGTVEAVDVDGMGFKPKLTLVDMLEMGTPHYMGIVALEGMFDALEALGGIEEVGRIACRVAKVCRILLEQIQAVKVYECDNSIVVFSLWRCGVALGWRRVVEALRSKEIIVRGGCMCNPGACQKLLGIGWKDGFGGCGGSDVVDNRHTGLVRASFGYGSSGGEAERIAQVVSELVNEPVRSWRVKNLYVYPVKGMAGISVQASKVESSGLAHDRCFGVVDVKSNKLLAVKDLPALAALHPRINEAAGNIEIEDREGETITFKIRQGTKRRMPLREKAENAFNRAGSGAEVDHVKSMEWMRMSLCVFVNEWLSKRVKRDVELVKKSPLRSQSLAKSRAFLVINSKSIEAFAKESLADNLEQRFRANIVIEPIEETNIPFDEDGWQGVIFRNKTGVVVIGAGRCRRCRVITVGPDGIMRKDREPLESLEVFRGGLGADFGQLFDVLDGGGNNREIRVGDVFYPI